MASSIYKYVCWHDKRFNPWKALKRTDGKRVIDKYFPTELAAARAVAKHLGVTVDSLRRKTSLADLAERLPVREPAKQLPVPKPRVLRVVFPKKQKGKGRIISGKELALSGDIESHGFEDNAITANLQARTYK